MANPDLEVRDCLVCAEPITVTHFGFDACRACAAFFKRTSIAKRSYICRQGDKKCTFRKHEKFMCRSCRYDRCVQLGMTYVAPAKRKPRRRTMTNVESAPSTSSSSSSSAISCAESILDRMEAEYRASCERRLPQEKHYVAVHKLRRFPYTTEELFTGNLTSFYEVFRITIRETMTVLKNVFDDFDNTPVPYRATLFKNFLGKFSIVEAVYYSSKYFGKSFHFMASLITCVDNNNVEGWVTDEDNIERKADFKCTLKGFAEDYWNLLIPISKMEELTEREFHALIALAYCDVDPSHHLPDDIINTAEKTRARLFAELQDYYRKELGLADFSNRLGNLMTVFHGAREAGNLLNEEMRMYATMFDVYSDDELYREIFLE